MMITSVLLIPLLSVVAAVENNVLEKEAKTHLEFWPTTATENGNPDVRIPKEIFKTGLKTSKYDSSTLYIITILFGALLTSLFCGVLCVKFCGVVSSKNTDCSSVSYKASSIPIENTPESSEDDETELSIDRETSTEFSLSGLSYEYSSTDEFSHLEQQDEIDTLLTQRPIGVQFSASLHRSESSISESHVIRSSLNHEEFTQRLNSSQFSASDTNNESSSFGLYENFTSNSLPNQGYDMSNSLSLNRDDSPPSYQTVVIQDLTSDLTQLELDPNRNHVSSSSGPSRSNNGNVLETPPPVYDSLSFSKNDQNLSPTTVG